MVSVDPTHRTTALQVSSAADTDARPARLRWAVLAAVSMVSIAAGIAAGWAVLTLTRPTDDELQRAVLDEVGLPADLETAPIIGPALDTYTDRIEGRILAESKPSATLALAVGVMVGVTGTVAAHAAAERMRPAQDHPPHDNTEMAHGRRH